MALLRRKGWTQRQLSRVTGVPIPTINDWTAGVSRVDLEWLRRVAEALEISVFQLAFGLERRDPFEETQQETGVQAALRDLPLLERGR